MFRSVRRKLARFRLESGLPAPFHHHRAIFIHIPKAAGTSVSIALFGHQVGHATALDRYAQDFAATRDYFKFTFVRDPLARALSAFKFMQGGGMTPRDEAYSKRLEGLTFEEFARRLSEFQDIEHFRPQHTFICHPYRRLLVDYVGRIETMAESFAYVAKKMGYEGQLPHMNSGSEKPSVDDETSQFIRDFYAKDYVLFGY
ncbi:sulfotransferase family 2 domain-containing protein [Novosphingobium malaysiense]|uniref:sulfotransferase family 2 domain-containing protein n=1 Tax=Novosphingobium malaysiense TaxID=1348853 RepID=UPI0006919AC4|nr:sulfotransferase family 2 domain-containing protein [Novosphingobium malaysiense]